MRLLSRIRGKKAQHKKYAKDAETDRQNEWWSITRKILPPTITETHEHLSLTDDTFVSCIVVGVPEFDTPGYSRTIDSAYLGDLLSTVKNRCFIGYSFAISPFGQAHSNRALEDAEFRNVQDQMDDMDTNSLGRIKNKTGFIATDIKDDQKAVHDQTAKQFDTACIITIRADSIAELNASHSQVTSILDRNLVGWTPAEGKMLETYKCAQPWGRITPLARVDCTSAQVASLLPMQRLDSRTAISGIWFGNQKTENPSDRGKPVMVDLSALSVEHGLVFGPSGSGKTAFLMVASMRAHDQNKYRTVYLTVKADAGTQFRNVPAHYKELGNVIDLGIGEGKSVINPLQIVYDATTLKGTDAEYLRIYHKHKMIVAAFFDTFLKTGLTDNQGHYLDRTLNEIYEKYDMISLSSERIVCHPEKWGDGENFPTIHELRKLWKENMAGSLGRLKESAESLYNRTGNLSKIGAYSYINSRSTADFSADYIVVDLSGLDKGIQDAMSTLVIDLIGARFNTDAKRKTMLIIDEGVAFSYNEARQSFISNAYTMGRSGQITVVMSFTDPGNISTSFATMLQTNSTWSYIFGKGLDVASVEYLKEFFRLDEGDTQELVTSEIGGGLLVLGTQKIPIYLKITDQEMDILKGRNNAPEKASSSGALMLLESVSELVQEQGFCLDEWVEDPNPKVMNDLGYVPHLVQRVDANGKAKAWVQADIIRDGMIYNQTLEHYSSVIMIAGRLLQSGFEDVSVNHFDKEDVRATFAGKSYSFEYERQGSHTEKQLETKCRKLESTNSRCFFVCQKSYEKFVAKAVGAHNTCTRGASFKGAIDAVLNEYNSDKKEDKTNE